MLGQHVGLRGENTTRRRFQLQECGLEENGSSGKCWNVERGDAILSNGKHVRSMGGRTDKI